MRDKQPIVTEERIREEFELALSMTREGKPFCAEERRMNKLIKQRVSRMAAKDMVVHFNQGGTMKTIEEIKEEGKKEGRVMTVFTVRMDVVNDEKGIYLRRGTIQALDVPTHVNLEDLDAMIDAGVLEIGSNYDFLKQVANEINPRTED